MDNLALGRPPFPRPLERGVTTLTRPVSGEQQNFSGNMEILPGIGRLEKNSAKHEIISGHCMKKSGQVTT